MVALCVFVVYAFQMLFLRKIVEKVQRCFDDNGRDFESVVRRGFCVCAQSE